MRAELTAPPNTAVFVCEHVWREGATPHLVLIEDEGDYQDCQVLCGLHEHAGCRPLLVCLGDVLGRFPALQHLIVFGGEPYRVYLPPRADEPVFCCAACRRGAVPALIGRDEHGNLEARCSSACPCEEGEPEALAWQQVMADGGGALTLDRDGVWFERAGTGWQPLTH